MVVIMTEEQLAASTQAPRRPLTLQDMERMRIPVRYRDVAFAYVSEGKHKQALRNYLLALDEMLARGVGLLLNGKNGTGKSSAAIIALKEARRRGHTGLFIECATLRDIKFGNKGFGDEGALWDRMLAVDVLVLDDLGKGVQDREGAEERLLDELLRYRGSYRSTTILTTNMSEVPVRRGEESQLEKYLKPSTLHMLKETSVSIQMVGQDLREGALEDVEERIFKREKSAKR